MSENSADELAELDNGDFTLPVTDAFVARVHRGVRRRRILRAGTAGGAVAATAIAVTAAASLAGITQSAPLPNSATDPSVASPPTFAAYPLYRPLSVSE